MTHDSITYRSRTVYSIITLVSEVSGFADILFITAGLFFVFFYTPKKLEVSLLEHMGPVELPKPQKKTYNTYSVPFSLTNIDVLDMLKSLTSRLKLRVSIWYIICQKLVPEQYRNEKATKLLQIADKSL